MNAMEKPLPSYWEVFKLKNFTYAVIFENIRKGKVSVLNLDYRQELTIKATFFELWQTLLNID
jgi:uncharacterized protein YkwD